TCRGCSSPHRSAAPGPTAWSWPRQGRSSAVPAAGSTPARRRRGDWRSSSKYPSSRRDEERDQSMSQPPEVVTPTAPEQPPAAGQAAPTRHVLIVEDDELAGRQLCRILQDDPTLEVALVREGQAALDELARRKYSVLITDLRMPGMDGMDLIR